MLKQFLFIGVGFLAVAVGLQYAAGAYHSEFGGYPDEAAHYVTGLMVHDYALSGFSQPPVAFAENYYLHYPRVSLGHWPPFFYLVQTAWSLLFSVSRTSLLLLMAVVSSLLALTLWRALRKDFGDSGGIAAGLLLLALPLVQIHTAMVMAEMVLTLTCFWAVLAYGRFFDTGRTRDAALFGLLASCAILTKGTGMALALLPVIVVLISRRFGLLRRWSFWLPAFIVLVLAGSWYLLMLHVVSDRESAHVYLSTPLETWQEKAWQLHQIAGWALGALALAGFITKMWSLIQADAPRGKWLAAGAWLLSSLIFQLFEARTSEARHVLPIAPVWLMFAAASLAWLRSKLPRLAQLAAAAAALLFLVECFPVPGKDYYGYQEIAQDLLDHRLVSGRVWMVSSDAAGQGMFISEVAMRERRPGHFVLRADQLQNRRSRNQAPAFQSTGEWLNYLSAVPVSILVLDASPRLKDQRRDQLMEMVRTFPDRWTLVGSYPQRRPAGVPGTRLLVYRANAVGDESALKFRIDMQPNLGRYLEAGPSTIK